MRTICVAVTQMHCEWDLDGNVERAVGLVEQAARHGANVVLLQELFATPYFCKDEDAKYFALASPLEGHPLIQRFSQLAKHLNVVLPVSFFEKCNNAFFNSVAMIDATGECLGVYRKAHIPEGPGYDEKFYFSPGNTRFKVWDTQFGRLGVGICWDQWFPEAARAMVLQGAEVLLYPTAIGSEPADASLDSKDHWQRVMQGHAAANLVPVVASNRIGEEQGDSCAVTFYGSSFMADHTGAKIDEANRTDAAVLIAGLDLDEIRDAREAWGVFRDRRPDLYGSLLTLDGGASVADAG
jgi:N-carbamoylputrescine amidase